MQQSLFAELQPKKAALNYYPNTSASEIARRVKKGSRIIGLTRGQFSLIDLIHAILVEVGGGDVVVVTWSAGIKDANTVKWMLDTELIRSFMLVTDHSYKTRQAKYALALSDLFGDENIRTSEIHAKFTTIRSGDLFITIRTSMNLNANKTCESFEIDESKEVFDFYHDFVTSTFGEMPKGFVASSEAVNRALKRSFVALENQFKWQES